MVGIPGRSRGCVTCRKRKKGCDLKQPACGQCKERNIVCGGYDVDRIFIHHTSTSTGIARDMTKERLSCQIQTRAKKSPVKNTHESDCHSTGQACTLSVLLPEGLVLSAYKESVLAAFLQMYMPRGGLPATIAEDHKFVVTLPQLSIYDTALQLTALALGSAALAKTTSDNALSRRLGQQSRALYGKALSETALALRNPSRAQNEAMARVPHLMAIFEILFGAGASWPTQSKSWLSHAIGEMALMTSRDPEEYSMTDAAHSLFVNARFRLLIGAFRTGKATVLNTTQWKTLPWRNRTKTQNDVLVDIFCGVPELREAVETLGSLTLSVEDAKELRTRTVAKAWALHLQLQDWLAANLSEILVPTTTDSILPISFPSLETACLTLRYWVVALLVYRYLDIASGICAAKDGSTAHSNRPHPRMYARFIARSVPYFFQPHLGMTGPITMTFPLGMALLYMRRNPAADAEYLAMITRACDEPLFPTAVRDFLSSGGKECRAMGICGEVSEQAVRQENCWSQYLTNRSFAPSTTKQLVKP